MSWRQATYGRVFRSAVAIIRAPRLHRWPVLGRPFARLAERVMSATHPKLVSVEGDLIHLDAHDDLGLARGRPYEPLLREIMQRYIPRGATVIDGGAHIGYHTMLAARLVGPEGHVIAFEPAPSTFAILADNIRRNGYANVSLVAGALSDRRGRGTLHLNSSWSGDHRIGDEATGTPIDIDLFSLDEYLTDLGPVDFLKLDIQGAEPLALSGARAVLDRSPRLVAAIEYDPAALPRSTIPRSFLEQLFERFATVLDVNDEARTTSPASPDSLLARYTRENRRHTNLVCMP